MATGVFGLDLGLGEGFEGDGDSSPEKILLTGQIGCFLQLLLADPQPPKIW